MADRPLRAVLFDLGGVILSSPFEAFAAFERERGLPDDFLRRVNAADHHTNAWARLERGELDLEGFDAAFAAESTALGHTVRGADVLALLAGAVRPEVVEAVRRCRERLHTGLLTNNVVSLQAGGGGEGRQAASAELAPLLELFDVIVESSQCGVRKPEARFYELALEALDIEASEAVFLDDLGVNLKPARAMGMHTIKVGDPAQALAELEAVVGFPLG
jgi:putative hydrolase of the HAD superfamily